MSDLTPDGDQADNVVVAIRSFLSSAYPLVSDGEFQLMQSWANACDDDENRARLQALMAAFRPRPA